MTVLHGRGFPLLRQQDRWGLGRESRKARMHAIVEGPEGPTGFNAMAGHVRDRDFRHACAPQSTSAVAEFAASLPRYRPAGAALPAAGASSVIAGLYCAYFRSRDWKRGSRRIGSQIGSSHSITGE